MKNIEGKNKEQLGAIKDQGERQLAGIEDQKNKQLDAIEKQKKTLIKKIGKDEKFKLKSLKYLIDRKDKMQAQYFDEHVNNKESTIEYSELYYQSGNKKKGCY